jgi:hypothetical protein
MTWQSLMGLYIFSLPNLIGLTFKYFVQLLIPVGKKMWLCSFFFIDILGYKREISRFLRNYEFVNFLLKLSILAAYLTQSSWM